MSKTKTSKKKTSRKKKKEIQKNTLQKVPNVNSKQESSTSSNRQKNLIQTNSSNAISTQSEPPGPPDSQESNIDNAKNQILLANSTKEASQSSSAVEKAGQVEQEKDTQTFFRRVLADFIAVIVIFSVSFGVIQLYLNESEVDTPFRADAGKYTRAAYNLATHGIFSDDLVSPYKYKEYVKRTDLAPGYPLFLMLIMKSNPEFQRNFIINRHNYKAFNYSIQQTQAVLGALISVATYLIARAAMPISWAILAGLLTAFSPHLIAMTGYALTETFFIFIMMLGTLVITAAWRSNNYFLTFLGSVLITLSSYIRYVNKLFLFAMAFIFLIKISSKSKSFVKSTCIHLLLIFTGFIFVQGAYHEFRAWTVTHEGALITNKTSKKMSAPKKIQSRHGKIKSLLAYLRTAATPPNFYIENKSHVMDLKAYSPAYHKGTTLSAGRSYWQNLAKYPEAYLKWILGGKLYILWHWDNIYYGDVYIYPMIRKGFEDNTLLKSIHRSMRFIHWPLFLLSLAAPIVLAVRWKKHYVTQAEKRLVVPVIGFTYLLCILVILSWLPRYTIPARPFSYILATATLFWLYKFGSSKLN